jgi:hypothetical protein
MYPFGGGRMPATGRVLTEEDHARHIKALDPRSVRQRFEHRLDDDTSVARGRMTRFELQMNVNQGAAARHDGDATVAWRCAFEQDMLRLPDA